MYRYIEFWTEYCIINKKKELRRYIPKRLCITNGIPKIQSLIKTKISNCSNGLINNINTNSEANQIKKQTKII